MWRFSLSFLVALVPSMVLANIYCPDKREMPSGEEAIALPGEHGYSSASYARLLFGHLESCLGEGERILLFGELTPKWRASDPLPHVQAEERQRSDYITSSDNYGYSVHFEYSDFYEFEGVQLTAKGPIPIHPDMVDGSAGAAEEGFWVYPMETSGPMIFTASFIKISYPAFLRLQVPGVGSCSTFPMPAADQDAIDHLTVCIAHNGCGPSQ